MAGIATAALPCTSRPLSTALKTPISVYHQATRTGHTLGFSSSTTLQANLNTALSTWRTTRLQRRQQVGDVIPRMPVKASAQPLLVEEVSNQTDTSAENEETVEHTHLQVVLSLLVGESTTVADKVNKADSNATVNVENQVVLLGRCD